MALTLEQGGQLSLHWESAFKRGDLGMEILAQDSERTPCENEGKVKMMLLQLQRHRAQRMANNGSWGYRRKQIYILILQSFTLKFTF